MYKYITINMDILYSKKSKIYIDINTQIFNSNQLVIICDKDGLIINISEKLLNLLNYKMIELKNKFIGVIMSPFLSFVHKTIIIPKYKSLNIIERKIIDIFISGTNYKRPMMIFDKNSNPINVNLSVRIFRTNDQSDFVFQINFEYINKTNNSVIYTREINTAYSAYEQNSIIKLSSDNSNYYNAAEFKITKNKIVVVSIDFRNSVEFLVSNGTMKTINIYKKFHNDVIILLKKNYYPYIYIHEIIGDCFIIVSNIDWSLNMPKFCASLIFSFLTELYMITNEYIETRIGVSYGNLHWGYIDNNLRLFGIPINLASRLESVCNPNSITCDDDFLNKLLEEKLFDTTKIIYTKTKSELKGLGEYNYNTIPINLKTNNDIFNIYNIG